MEQLVLVIFSAILGFVVLLLFFFVFKRSKADHEETISSGSGDQKIDSLPVGDESKASGKQKFQGKKKAESKASVFTHEWLAGSLKGHGDGVLDMDFSSNGKYLISCAEDRSIMLWSTKDFHQKDHKFVRARVELDHATKVKMSPDNRAFIVSLSVANTVRVFKIGKKDDGTVGNIQAVLDFPVRHKGDIISIGIASNGKFIMTCSRDTTMIIWDLKGEVLSTVETLQVNNSYAAVSPCGRFVASSGFTSDIKVWDVSFDKAGNFKEVRRAFELKGHSASVHSFAFNNDSTRMASVSKDGTWKLWDTNIDYQRGQEPYLLKTGQFPNTAYSLISLSPDARTVATASGSDVAIFNTDSGKCDSSIKDLFSGKVTKLEFDIRSRYLAASGDKAIYVFHNVSGLRCIIDELEKKLPKATSPSMKERLQEQITTAKKTLEEIGQSSSIS